MTAEAQSSQLPSNTVERYVNTPPTNSSNHAGAYYQHLSCGHKYVTNTTMRVQFCQIRAYNYPT